MNQRMIRAKYDEKSITIYQAYNKIIAQSSVSNQTFISPPFKKKRMTWIKPSFTWMMYRSGWASKENQEHILAVRIKRAGFEWALQNSCLSHFDATVYSSYEEWVNSKLAPVRIQWDPEKDIFLQPLPYRSIQIGLSGIAMDNYLTNWIMHIDDITDYCNKIHQLIKENKISLAIDLLPIEKPYPLTKNTASTINSDYLTD